MQTQEYTTEGYVQAVGRAIRRTRPNPLPAAVAAADAVDDRFKQLEATAAVSGPFDPDALGQHPAGAPLVALSRLSEACLIDTTGDRVQWTLKPERRREVLNRLTAAGRLAAVLAAPLPPTDDFGTMLRRLLRRESVVPEPLDEPRLKALLAAREELDGVAGVSLPSAADIRRALEPMYHLAELDVLLEHGCVGRDVERGTVAAFLHDGPVVLTVEGVGGAGKSTLVAQILRDLTDTPGVAVALLDFDRPGIRPDDPEMMAAEVSRQIGRQYPAEVEPLRQLREAVRRQWEQDGRLSAGTGGRSTSLESVSRERAGTNPLLTGCKEALVRQKVTTAVIVFDTFEVAAAEDGQVSKFVELLYDWPGSLYPVAVKVLVAGRVVELDADLPRVTLVIDALVPAAAESLVRRLGTDREAARRVARLNVGLTPLYLKALAEALAGGSLTLDELEREAGAGKQVADKLIVRRVVNHLGSRLAQQCVYPGFALRTLTAELVTDVLAKALELTLPAGAAAAAVTAIGRRAWLATAVTPGVVRPRPELRKTILRYLQPDEREQAQTIHAVAEAHFAKDRDEASRVEALYHRLMQVKPLAADAALPDIPDLDVLGPRLAEVVDELPPTAAALYRLRAKHTLRDEDYELLPRQVVEPYYHPVGRRLVAAGEYLRALRHLRRGTGPPETDAPSFVVPWEIDTLYSTVEWDAVPPHLTAVPPTGKPPLQTFVRGTFPGLLTGSGDPAWVSALDPSVVGFAVDDLLPSVAAGGDGDLLLARLLAGLALLRHSHPPPHPGSSIVPGVVSLLAASPALPRASILQSRLAILQAAYDWPTGVLFRATPSTVCLDDGKLAATATALRMAGQAEMAACFEAARSALQAGLGGPEPTARRVLSAVDQMYAHRDGWDRAAFDVPPAGRPELLPLARGPDWEFRFPCRYALLEAFPRPTDWAVLAGLLADVLPYRLADLDPIRFADAMQANPEHGLEVYVELADRGWRLGQLLEKAAAARPQSRKVERVRAAWQAWDRTATDALRGRPAR